MEPRIYVYKITFVGQPYWYWGIHKEASFGEYYMGSPRTNKVYWDIYEPVKEILEVFEYSDEGWNQAQLREAELIKPDLDNDLCLNENCAGLYSLRVMSEAAKELWKDPEYRDKQQKTRNNPGYRDMASMRLKERWKDLEFREKMVKLKQDPEFKKGVSESTSSSMKEKWEDPEFRDRVVSSKREPSSRARASESQRKNWEDEDYRNRMLNAKSEAFKKNWENEEYREKVSKSISEALVEVWKDPEYKDKVSLSRSRLWEDPNYREKVISSQKETFSRIGHQKGPKNSQFGTMWITDGTKGGNRKVHKGDEIPPGFYPGMTRR